MTVEEAPLTHVRVHDAMHTGILMTDPTTPLRVVARLMADQRVHAVAVSDPHHARRPFGIVTTLDVAAAVADGSEETAGQAAARAEIVTIVSTDSLVDAAGTMVKHGVTHLIVIDPANGCSTGVLSSLDVAAAFGA